MAGNFDVKQKNLNSETSNKAKTFLQLLSEKTGWAYNPKNWAWNNFRVYKFSKGIIKPGQARYDSLMQKNPVSFAITGSQTLEFTLDEKQQI